MKYYVLVIILSLLKGCSMQIDSLLSQDGSSDYYVESFRSTLEAHMSYLKTASSTIVQTVDIQMTIVYKNDLYGYLNEINIKPCMRWVVMRLNDLLSATDFNSSVVTVLIPSEQELERIRRSWKTTQRINA